MYLGMLKFTKEQVGDVLQRLYNSEINFLTETFFDAGWKFFMGDRFNGFDYSTQYDVSKVDPTSIADTVSAMAYTAATKFPESEFSVWYKTLQP